LSSYAPIRQWSNEPVFCPSIIFSSICGQIHRHGHHHFSATETILAADILRIDQFSSAIHHFPYQILR